MAHVPSLKFLRKSLRTWRALRARDTNRVARDQGKIKLRLAQLAQRLLLNAAAKPTVMYDSTNVAAIPTDAPAVAGYTAGKFPTYPKLVAGWPKARHLSIAVASRYDADCLDVEQGDATPEVAAGWVRRQQARGVQRPVVYCSVSAVTAVLAQLAHAGIPRTAIRLWTAHYTMTPHLCGPQCSEPGVFTMPTTADATQWTDKALGRVLDQSLVAPGFWAT